MKSTHAVIALTLSACSRDEPKLEVFDATGIEGPVHLAAEDIESVTWTDIRHSRSVDAKQVTVSASLVATSSRQDGIGGPFVAPISRAQWERACELTGMIAFDDNDPVEVAGMHAWIGVGARGRVSYAALGNGELEASPFMELVEFLAAIDGSAEWQREPPPEPAGEWDDTIVSASFEEAWSGYLHGHFLVDVRRDGSLWKIDNRRSRPSKKLYGQALPEVVHDLFRYLEQEEAFDVSVSYLRGFRNSWQEIVIERRDGRVQTIRWFAFDGLPELSAMLLAIKGIDAEAEWKPVK